MKKILSATPIVILLLCLLAQISYTQSDQPFSLDQSPLPKPSTPVLDQANVIDAATQKRIEDKIIEFQKTSENNVELAVATVKTTGNRPIFDYSIAVARGWGIGSREQDNPGALLFVAVNDRKYFTQVSSDLEDELPDGLVGSLQRQYLVPQFKLGNYGKGIEDTIDAYIRTINSKNLLDENTDGGEFIPSGETTTNREYRPRSQNDQWGCESLFPCLIILGIILFIVIANSSGGGGGGGGGGKKRRRKYKTTGDDVFGDILTGVLTGIVLGGGSDGGSSSSDWGSGGSSWGGSSGGGGWGGFGGGGDFGGGGAGGGW